MTKPLTRRARHHERCGNMVTRATRLLRAPAPAARWLVQPLTPHVVDRRPNAHDVGAQLRAGGGWEGGAGCVLSAIGPHASCHCTSQRSPAPRAPRCSGRLHAPGKQSAKQAAPARGDGPCPPPAPKLRAQGPAPGRDGAPPGGRARAVLGVQHHTAGRAPPGATRRRWVSCLSARRPGWCPSCARCRCSRPARARPRGGSPG